MSSSTVPPHPTNLVNEVDPRLDTSSQEPAAGDTFVSNTNRYETGPAPHTARPHRSDIPDGLDSRVNSDLDNRVQYTPGTTTADNTRPIATESASNLHSSNYGPHDSGLTNKIDPRVDSRNDDMANYTQSAIVPGASTEAPAAPYTATPSSYNKNVPSTYNPAMGTGYNKPQYNDQGNPSATNDNRTQQAPSTTIGIAPDKIATGAAGSPAGAGGSGGSTGKTGNAGGIGQSIKNTLASIHGAGESVRGTVGAAIDRKFNNQAGVEKNEAIAREGEYEVKSGDFASSTKAREGFNTNRR